MATASRIALITGANKGIGLETARQLGRLGITVLLGSRDAGRGAAAVADLAKDGVSASVLPLEVIDEPSIAAAAARVATEHGRLDILINNAGILDHAAETGPESTTLATYRRVFETNFFGLIAVTQAFLPLLKKSPAGRIVNLTSILGSCAEHSDPNSPIFQARYTAYDTSKAAVNLYTIELALALAGTPIKVNAAHPGWVKTDLGGDQAPLGVVEGARTTVALATLGAEGPSGGFFHQGVHMRW
ncbi:MAG: SDR family oxidoreductase [Planctomycetes bacterium]|nr:SDR family oxidoreductase [Planctomycetota bacterium]